MQLRSHISHRGTDAMLSCPVHDEATPSLHVTWSQGHAGGYTMLHCFGCRAPGDELAEGLGLRLSDLFDEPHPERERAWKRSGPSPARRQGGRRRGPLGKLPAVVGPDTEPVPVEPEHAWVEVARYPYVDLEGVVVQFAIRRECRAEGEPHKEFRQAFVARGRVVTRKPEGFVPVLYRWPEVAAAIRRGEPVWVLEGEKDADTAAELGLAATTNPQGAGSFDDALIPALAGAHLKIVVDRDLAGYARGVDLAQRLGDTAASLELFLPRTDGAKADFTDHVQAGFGVADLIPLPVTQAALLYAVSAAEGVAERVTQSIEQADLHASLVGAGSDPRYLSDAEHRTRATRWVLEGQIRFERLVEAHRLIEFAALRDGSDPAAETLRQAEQTLDDMRALVRACHDRFGVPVPPVLRPPELEPAGEPRKNPVDAGRSASSQFRVWNGEVVQWKQGKPLPEDEDFDPADSSGSYKVLLSMVVRVTVREFDEVEEDLAADEVPTMGRATTLRRKVKPLRRLAAVRIRYDDPGTREEMEVRIPVDAWRDHSWLEALPGAPDYDTRRAGKEVVQRAVMAVSPDIEEKVLRTATGWCEQPDGRWGFVHARGVITAAGHHDDEVCLSAGLERYDLPDPVGDPARLREAFWGCSATMLERLPDRVAAPVLGHVYRAAMGRHCSTVALVGQKATYKTSIAAKVMNHFGEAWGRTRYGSSMSGSGDTDNALRYKLHHARDTLYFLDDFAPTDSWAAAQKRMETVARMVHNQEARDRMVRDGRGLNAGQPPRAAALMTSEVMPRPGSGADRLLAIPLSPHEIERDHLFALDDADSRHGRALLTASFIRWLAEDYLARREHYQRQGSDYAARIAEDGSTDREAEVLGHLWCGWMAMTEFLVAVTAITVAEQRLLLDRVDLALRTAIEVTVDPDQPRTAGGRVLELIRHAFGQGLAFADDYRSGDSPQWPIAGRLGWRRTQTEPASGMSAAKYRFDRLGIKAGYVCTDPGYRDRGRVLMLEPTALESILKAANASQTDQMQIDRATAQVALADLGVLVTHREPSGATRYAIPCRIPAEDNSDRRFLVLWLDKVLGDHADGDDRPTGDRPGGDGDGSWQETSHDGTGSTDNKAGNSDPIGRSPGLDAPQQIGLASPEALDETPQPQEVGQVPQTFTFTPQSYTDRDGVIGWSEAPRPDDPGDPCVVCGRRCGMLISGIRVHVPCWEASSDGDRTPADADAATEPAAPPAAAHSDTTPAPPSARPPASGSARAGGERCLPAPAAAAAVVDLDGIWTSSGEHIPLPDVSSVVDLFQLGRRLRLGTAMRDRFVVDGQIWLGDGLARQLGIDVESIKAARVTQRDKVAHDASRDAAGVRAARDAGVFLGARDSDSLGRWTRLWRAGEPTGIRLVLMAAMNPAQSEPRLMTGDPTAQQLARRIGLLAAAMRYPFQHGASSTGLDLMTGLRSPRERERLFQVVEPCPPAMLLIEDDIDWCRPPTDEEGRHQWCHAYDRAGSYLGGIAGLKLGIGVPTHHPDGTGFTKEMPGYWRVQIPDQAADWRYPALLDYTGRRHGQARWVSTPTLQLALENDVPVEVLEAWTWPENGRILDTWYERMRDARDQLDIADADAQIARDQVKEIYTKTIGMLGSHQYHVGKPTYRPDWRHHIQGKSNANVLRRILAIGYATGRWPVAVKKDTIVYTSDDPDPVTAWPGGEKTYGRGLGKYKHEGSAPLGEQLRYLVGGSYKGRDALIAGADAGGE